MPVGGRHFSIGRVSIVPAFIVKLGSGSRLQVDYCTSSVALQTSQFGAASRWTADAGNGWEISCRAAH